MNAEMKHLLEAFNSLGFDDPTINKDALESSALLNNPYFLKAVAEYKVALIMQEDKITADPSIDHRKASDMRKYYSMMRIVLDGVVNTLDRKIQYAEGLDSGE